MISLKKHLSLTITCSFLTLLCFTHYLWSQETPKKIASEEQKGKITPKENSEQNQPHLTITDIQYNAGDVYEGNEIAHSFAVKNTGTAELLIKDVKAG